MASWCWTGPSAHKQSSGWNSFHNTCDSVGEISLCCKCGFLQQFRWSEYIFIALIIIINYFVKELLLFIIPEFGNRKRERKASEMKVVIIIVIFGHPLN